MMKIKRRKGPRVITIVFFLSFLIPTLIVSLITCRESSHEKLGTRYSAQHPIEASFEEVVPNEVFVLYVSDYFRNGDPTNFFVDGIRKISDKYSVKGASQIIGHYSNGNNTEALLIFVEPRQK